MKLQIILEKGAILTASVSMICQVYCMFNTIHKFDRSIESFFAFAGTFMVMLVYGSIYGIFAVFTPKKYWN